MVDELPTLPSHESGVRRMVSDAAGIEYRVFVSLADARQDKDAAVILEGDDGGQVFAVFPVGLIKCDEATLTQLLRDLDEIAWPGNPPDMARVFFEHRPIGGGVAGGMGGGRVTADGWVHPEFEVLQLGDQIRDVIVGRLPRIRSTPGTI